MRIIAIREKTFAIASPIRNAFQPFGGFPDDIRVEAGYVRMHDTAGMVSSGNPLLEPLGST